MLREFTDKDTKFECFDNTHWLWCSIHEESKDCLLFLNEDKPKGAICWRAEPYDTFHISKIEIFPQHREKGYGRIFMEELIEYARNEEFAKMDAWCELPVAEFYYQMGFEKTQDGDRVNDADIIRVERDLRF